MDWVQLSGLFVIVAVAVTSFFILDFKHWLHKRRKTGGSSEGEQDSLDHSATRSLEDEIQSRHEGSPRTQFVIEFEERATMPDRLQHLADTLGITVEQLIKRFIASGMQVFEGDGPAVPGETLEDFFVKNGVLKERK
ncbi:hypothetical protein [Marinobacter salarius]|uniref:hypothetical protein n=1 Tax=Marinobacter salarius TaxID=1420917 RepID=UPI003D1155AD